MSLRKAGYVVGEVDTMRFTFVSDMDSFPPRYEYLVIPGVDEREGIGKKPVDVLAQVNRIINYSDILSSSSRLRPSPSMSE